MEEMFIGTNANGLVVGDPTVLAKALPNDPESCDMVKDQLYTASTEVKPYVDVEDSAASVSLSTIATEPEFCM